MKSYRSIAKCIIVLSVVWDLSVAAGLLLVADFEEIYLMYTSKIVAISLIALIPTAVRGSEPQK